MDRSPEILRAAYRVEQRMRLERKLKRKVRRIETKEILASISPDRRAKLAKALKLYDGDRAMNLYNCKHADGGYRLTKFTKDYEVESSYVVSAEGCDCPAGIRPVCRHRTMLPFFLEHEHVDDGWFFIWDTRQWLRPIKELEIVSEVVLPDDATGEEIAKEFGNLLRPQGAPNTSDLHDSDCATHNEPAMPNGPCDCSLSIEQADPGLTASDGPAQPAPPTVSTPIAPQTTPASAEGAGFRFRRPVL